MAWRLPSLLAAGSVPFMPRGGCTLIWVSLPSPDDIPVDGASACVLERTWPIQIGGTCQRPIGLLQRGAMAALHRSCTQHSFLTSLSSQPAMPLIDVDPGLYPWPTQSQAQTLHGAGNTTEKNPRNADNATGRAPQNTNNGAGWPDTALQAGTPSSTLSMCRCGLCKCVSRDAVRIDNSTNTMDACDHVFCAQCLGTLLVKTTLTTSPPKSTIPGFVCPAKGCTRFVVEGDIYVDEKLRSLVATMLRPGAANNHVGVRKHTTRSPETRKHIVDMVSEQGGWAQLRHDFGDDAPSASTVSYWMSHPYLLAMEHRPGAGRPTFFTAEQEDELRRNLFARDDPTNDDFIWEAVSMATRLYPEKPFFASSAFQRGFYQRQEIAAHLGHPVAVTHYNKLRAALATKKEMGEKAVSDLELNMLWSLADARAKRRIFAEVFGLTSLKHFIANDEMRIKPDILFNKGKKKFLVDRRNLPPSQLKGRKFIPSPVSQSCSGLTILTTVSLDGTKLIDIPVILTDKKHKVKVTIPDRDELIAKLGLDPASDDAKRIPATTLVSSQTPKSWNSSHVHSTLYLDKVLQPHRDAHDLAHQSGTCSVKLSDPPPALPPPKFSTPLVLAALLHRPPNPIHEGAIHASPRPELCELHDTFQGHTAKRTRGRYRKKRVCSAVVAANCTGFMQWHDKYLHHHLRPMVRSTLWKLIRRRGPKAGPIKEVEWRDLVAEALCLVWWDPKFFPPAQILAQMEHMGLALPTDGSRDDEITLDLFGFHLHTNLVQPMAEHRFHELVVALSKETPVAETEEESSSSEDEEPDEEDGAELDIVSFRAKICVGQQVAIWVSKETEGVEFLVAQVLEANENSEYIKIHWYSPFQKGLVHSKWCPDMLKSNNKPSTDKQERGSTIPIPLVWQEPGFKRKKGGKLKASCIAKLLAWIEDQEQADGEEFEVAFEDDEKEVSLGEDGDEEAPAAPAARPKRKKTRSTAKANGKKRK